MAPPDAAVGSTLPGRGRSRAPCRTRWPRRTRLSCLAAGPLRGSRAAPTAGTAGLHGGLVPRAVSPSADPRFPGASSTGRPGGS
eukprot:4446907-Lingulodinium_polyedra.AAC.1